MQAAAPRASTSHEPRACRYWQRCERFIVWFSCCFGIFSSGYPRVAQLTLFFNRCFGRSSVADEFWRDVKKHVIDKYIGEVALSEQELQSGYDLRSSVRTVATCGRIEGVPLLLWCRCLSFCCSCQK